MPVRLTERDFGILQHISWSRIATEKQIGALFYTNGSYTIDHRRARSIFSRRLCKLVRAGYLSKTSFYSYHSFRSRRAYHLGEEGVRALRSHIQTESLRRPRFDERTANDVAATAAHDHVAGNFLVNLLCLSRLHPHFEVLDWRFDRDCRQYIDRGKILLPDYFLATAWGDQQYNSFVEIDLGTISTHDLNVKIRRYLEYASSNKWSQDLHVDQFPRCVFLVPTQRRAHAVTQVIRDNKSNNPTVFGSYVRLPFWIATFQAVDVNAIDHGRVSPDPLEPVWIGEDDYPVKSPLAPQ